MTPATSEWAKLEWMGRQVTVRFQQQLKALSGEYTYDGFDSDGAWLTDTDGRQRHILWYDIEKVELT